ncbi:MAG: hypothetical protein HY054_02495 [Proteobacteria bacterium]|nr:hypothetical protein [Pseudomonadota bacterium]
MRQTSLALLALLAACATVPGVLPTPRYADAASRGMWGALLAGRPTRAQVDEATERWSEALGDSFACHVSTRQVIDAGLVGALDIGAMNAASSGGGAEEVRAGVGRYIVRLASLATQQRERPSPGRCDALAQWAPHAAEAGREAVRRARANGLMDNNYGLLMDLLVR